MLKYANEIRVQKGTPNVDFLFITYVQKQSIQNAEQRFGINANCYSVRKNVFQLVFRYLKKLPKTMHFG